MVIAVLAGYAVAGLMVTAGAAAADAGFGLRMDGRATTAALAINITVRFAGAIAAGYLVARLAPVGRIVMTLALLMLVLLSAAVVSTRLWPELLQPPSYLPLATLLGIIGVWTGAMVERAVHWRH
jgi:hypothetical protein